MIQGFDTERTAPGALVVGARSDGALAVDDLALGAWLSGARPWPTSGHLREGRAESRGAGGVLRAADVLAVHNAAYDLAPYRDGERTPASIADSLILSWLDDENPPHGLKVLASRRLGRHLDDPITVPTIDGEPRVLFEDVPIEAADPCAVADYCHEDARASADLAAYYLERLPARLRRWYWEIEEPHLRSCIATSRLGLPVDAAGVAPTLAHARGELDAATEALWALVGWEVNPASPDQVAALLYDEVVWRRERRLEGQYRTGRERWRWREAAWPGFGLEDETGERSTKAAVLETLQAPAAEAILAVREWAKLVGTYLEPMAAALDGEGRLHPRLNPVGTVTGRISMSGPNLQTLPTRRASGKLVKRLVMASPGARLVIADYSQLEFRIMAESAGIRVEGDVHQAFADMLGCSRAQAKTYEYGAIYGAGPAKLASVLKCSVEDAKAGMAGFWAALPQVRAWKRRIEDQARSQGYVELPSGRRRNLPDATLDAGRSRRLAGKVAGALRQAVNVTCQGAGADVMRCALASLWEDGVVPVLQVHDSIVLEVPEAEAQDVAEHLTRRMLAAGVRAGVGAKLAVDVTVTERWEEPR